MLGQDESAISNLLVGEIEPAVADLGPTIEEGLEDLFESLSLETEVAMGDAVVDLALYPSRVEFGDAGMVIGLGALVELDSISDCVDGSGGSDLVGAGWPDFAEVAEGTTLEYDAGIFVGADFLDHLLYAIWAGGGLCIDVDEFSGTSLTSTLLGGFVGEEMDELFIEEVPAVLRGRPVVPPTSAFSDDGAAIRVQIEQLGLDALTVLDERWMRLFQVDVEAEMEIDLPLDEEGFLPTVEMPDDKVLFQESYSDFLTQGYSDGIAELGASMIGSFIGDDLLPAVALPELLGIEVETLMWVPTDSGDWIGGYLLLDTSGIEPLELGGCSASGLGCDGGEDTGGEALDFESALGCDDGDALGCDETSCSVVPTGRHDPHSRSIRRARISLTRWAMVLALALALVRRRRA
jgi:hypothetical protein